MFGILDPDKQLIGAYYRWDYCRRRRPKPWYVDYCVQVFPATSGLIDSKPEHFREIRDRIEAVIASVRPTPPPTAAEMGDDQRYLARKWADALNPVEAIGEVMGSFQGILVRATYGAWGTSHLPQDHQRWEMRFAPWDAPATRGEELMTAEAQAVVGILFGRG